MSIPSVAATASASPLASVTTPVAPTSAAVTATRAIAQREVEIDQVTQLPVPPRFPWLSRLSQQLESATGQRPPFEPAPVLGDHINRAV